MQCTVIIYCLRVERWTGVMKLRAVTALRWMYYTAVCAQIKCCILLTFSTACISDSTLCSIQVVQTRFYKSSLLHFLHVKLQYVFLFLRRGQVGLMENHWGRQLHAYIPLGRWRWMCWVHHIHWCATTLIANCWLVSEDAVRHSLLFMGLHGQILVRILLLTPVQNNLKATSWY